ncbi:MAG TPA: hypothetical protein VNQ90_04490 [Chthoniobacteraceae bacterium]|nr:hypothetical protein [Chthoniobacteraceae bacterium]
MKMTLSGETAHPPFSYRELPSGFTQRLAQSARMAARWLVETAQVREPSLTTERHAGFAYDDWKGAIRGEYRAATRGWSFFCPYWHTGQAVKALLMLEAQDRRGEWMQAARLGGDFLLRCRIAEPGHPDFGLPLAFEDIPHAVNTSAILEGVDGLFHLADATGQACYEEAAIEALYWVARHAYLDGQGLFHDFYDPGQRRFIALSEYRPTNRREQPRPLLDDAVFLKGCQRTGEALFSRIYHETAEELLRSEHPAGNWIAHGPCHAEEDHIHPRHAYWWGGSLFDGWSAFGTSRYREGALRSADWYARALRRDGGFFRNTSIDFNTDSFHHATSGSACAAIVFLRASMEAGEHRYLPLAIRALTFCMDAQFVKAKDPNLKGAILEKILPPDGSDDSPYHLRDLGSIFFIQAAALALQRFQA